MKIYTLSREAIDNEKRKGLIRSIATAVFAITIGAGIPIIAGLAPMWILAVMIPFLVVTFSVSIRRGLKIVEENQSSFQLLVGLDFIVKKQQRMPDVEIYSNQITQIEERKGTGLLIRTSDKQSFISIPEGLDGYDEVKDQASKWRAFDLVTSRKEYGPLLQMLAILSFGIAFALLWLSNNLGIVIAAGIFIIVYMIWALTYLKRRKDIDARLKLSTWKMIFLLLVLAIMLYGRITVLLTK